MSDKTKETGNNTTPYDPFNVTNLSTNQGSEFCNLKPEMEKVNILEGYLSDYLISGQGKSRLKRWQDRKRKREKF